MILAPHGRRRRDGRLGGSSSQRRLRAGLAQLKARKPINLVVMIMGPHGRRRRDGRLGGSSNQRGFEPA